MSTEIQELKFKVAKDAKLDVSNIRGFIHVSKGKNKEIIVKANKVLDSGDSDNTKVIIEQAKSGEVTVQTEYKNDTFNWGWQKPCKVEYDILVPPDIQLRTNSVSGETTVEDLAGSFDLNTVSGDVTVGNLSGALKLNSVSGNVIGNGLNGSAYIESVSGDVLMNECDFPKMNINTVSGRMVVESPIGEGPYRLNTVSGSAKMIVAKKTAASIYAHSLSGRFKTSLDATKYSYSHGTSRSEINGGGTKIHMHSFSGNLYLVTSKDDKAVTPSTVYKTNSSKRGPTFEERKEILNQIHNGTLSIDDALAKLA